MKQDSLSDVKSSRPDQRFVLPFLRLEGACAAAIALYLYSGLGAGWWLFAFLILAPDLAMLGYLRDTRTGAIAYNVAHSYAVAALFWLIAYMSGWSMANPIALIWISHIGIDRMLGYGLKYPDAFRHTHLSSG